MIKEKLKRGTFLYKIYLYYNIFIRYRFFKRNKKTFSQFGEDLFIENFFKDQKQGKYVDLGAFHPMRLSNTYLLYKKGWTGTNIDLNPIAIDLFNIARKKDRNICGLISDQNNVIKDAFFDHQWSAANSIVPDHTLSFKKKMKTSTFNSLIDSNFDFLNIDLEGHDYDVLKTINFNKFKPKLICIEILHEGKNKVNIFDYMKINKYLFLKNLGPSYFFKKE